MYPQEIVLPMKEQLTDNGFQELLTSTEVDDQLQKTGTTLVMVNSVCGCSAGSARPGVLTHHRLLRPAICRTSENNPENLKEWST